MSLLKTLLRLSVGVSLFVCSAAGATEVVTYYYTDAQGTPLATTDLQGSITSALDYRPYATSALGQSPDGPGYTGHVNEPDTGLVYMQARYYDPEIGRFLSVDPAAIVAGGASTFARYTYGSSNPYSNVDPDGRQSSECNGDDCHQKPPPTPCSKDCVKMRNTSDHGIAGAIASRSSFTADGAVAYGAGVDVSATKQVGDSKDSGAVNFVVGEGAMSSAMYNFKVWSSKRDINDGITFTADPSSYLKVKIGADLALGLVVTTDPRGNMDVSAQIGAGLGEEVIYKPPVSIGVNKSF